MDKLLFRCLSLRSDMRTSTSLCVTLHYEIYSCSFKVEGDLRVRTEDLSNLTKIKFIPSDCDGSFLLRPLTCYNTPIFLVFG